MGDGTRPIGRGQSALRRRARSTRRLLRTAVRGANRALNDVSYRLDLPIVLGGPSSLMVEPSARCNLGCPMCPTGIGITKRDRYTLRAEDFERSLGWFRHTLHAISFWNYGEPFLNRELAKMVAVANRYDINTQVSTNGHFLEGALLDELFRAGLTRLTVSIDTPDGEVYERYRVGGELAKVERGIRHAVARKAALGAQTEIVAQYMTMRDSEDVAAMREHGLDLGVDAVFVKTIGIGSAVPDPTEHEWSFMPESDDHKRYFSEHDVRPRVRWDDEQRCSYIWGRMVLSSDGTCLPCCRDQLAAFDLGTVGEGKTLPSIWNSRAYRQFRKEILDTQRREVMCQRCPELVHESSNVTFRRKEPV